MSLKRLLALAFLCGVIGVIGCGKSVDISKIQLEPLDSPGEKVTIGDYKGKVVLIDYWATWCGPCQIIRPMVGALREKYANKDFKVLSVTNEDRKTVETFEKDQMVALPTYLDGHGELQKALGIDGIPTLIILDKNGNIVKVQVGASETLEELDDAIQKYL